jgi:hypothetical protein
MPMLSDYFFLDYSIGSAEPETGVDEPEEEEEATDGAEDDADHSARGGACVEAGVRGGDGEDGLAF